jgi:hypothetical protein
MARDRKKIVMESSIPGGLANGPFDVPPVIRRAPRSGNPSTREVALIAEKRTPDRHGSTDAASTLLGVIIARAGRDDDFNRTTTQEQLLRGEQAFSPDKIVRTRKKRGD